MQRRQVQTLRIRAPQPEQARHAVVELEDALRTASFGNLPRNGVVYIRRLDLGTIGAKPQRAALSRRIERSLWSLPGSAIRRITTHDDLPEAEAVWFPTPAAALCAAVERIVRGQPLRAWYWRRVLGVDPARRVAVTEATVIAAAERVAPAEQTVLSVLRHINRLGALPALARQLSTSRLASQMAWLRSRVITEAATQKLSTTTRVSGAYAEPPESSALESVPVLLARLPAGARLQLRAAMERGEDSPERLQWLLLASHELAGVKLAPAHWATLEAFSCEPAAAERVACLVEAASAAPHSASVADRASQSVTAPEAPKPEMTEARKHSAAPAENADADSVADPYAPRILRRRPFPETDFNWAGSWLWGGRPTPAAGLMFLWPVWQHLGLARSLAAHPWLEEGGFAGYLLLRLGQWLGLPPDEPMLNWLQPVDRNASGEWQAPPLWRELLQPQWQRFGRHRRDILGQRAELALAGRVVLSLEGAADSGGGQLPLLADSWLRLSARWLLANGLRVRRLVERPGAVAATDTHVDICLKVEDSDLQVRKLGLDIDPGWQPAMGKVIQYHYIQRENGDA